MTAFSPIDLGEVLRLTQAGRLSEATSMLQGRTTAVDPHTRGGMAARMAGDTKPSWRMLDMVAPSNPGGPWMAPNAGSGLTGFGKTSAGKAGPSDRQGLAETLRVLRERFPRIAARVNLGEGAGEPRRAPISTPDGARFEERVFASEVGSRSYKVYVPSGYTGQALPLIVMLHGCTQSPDDIAAGTRMNALAEEQTFLVAYPAQSPSANLQKCWNWFNASDQQREGGEPELITGIVHEVVRKFSADPTRVYAAGMSAGGAAAAVLAVTHPDVFAAIGVHSGLPFGAAKDMPSAFAAMKGNGTTPPKMTRAPVPTIVFHGDADRTVSPVNGDRIIAQLAPEMASTKVVTRGEAPGGVGYTRTVRSDDSGRPVLEQWVVHGTGHAWSGGSSDGSYTDPRGPDASREMVRFFLAHTNPRSWIRQ